MDLHRSQDDIEVSPTAFMSSQPDLLQFLKIVLQTDGEACDGDIGDDFVLSNYIISSKNKT